MSIYDSFTNKYPITKTLRFELRPVGKTGEHIKKENFLKIDENRDKEYQCAKKIIDEYHKDFIEHVLSGFSFDENMLHEYETLSNEYKTQLSSAQALSSRESDELQKKFRKIQENLRKSIAKTFKDSPAWKTLFKKELLKKDIPNWLRKLKASENNRFHDVDDIRDIGTAEEIISKFGNWTTYFQGFHDNRKNIYSDEDKATAISYRVVHENLPRFVDNNKRYKKLKEQAIDMSAVENTARTELDELGVKTLNELFQLSTFNNVLTQKGIERYNTIRGGQVLENEKKKSQGINEKINLLMQQEDDRTRRNALKKLTLTELYKQILSDRQQRSFLPEAFNNGEQVLTSIRKFYTDISEKGKMFEDRSVLNKLRNCLLTLPEVDSSRVYINSKELSNISRQYYGNWDVIKIALSQWAASKKKSEKERDRILKQDVFRISDIQEALDNARIDDMPDTPNALVDILKQPKIKPVDNSISEPVCPFEQTRVWWKTFNEKFPDSTTNKVDVKSDTLVPIIKNFLDALQDLLHAVKPLYLDRKTADKYNLDNGFYEDFDAAYEELAKIIPLYNKVRNYVTQKRQIEEKYKLNFENQTLADGWSEGKKIDNTCMLFRRNGQYYLGIMNPKAKKIFKQDRKAGSENYEEMVYYQIADAGKDIQNIIKINGKYERKLKNSSELKQKYIPDIARIKEAESYKTTHADFRREDLHTFIDYYKDAARGYWSQYHFSFKNTNEYQDFNEFTNHIDSQGYSLTFRNVSVEFIDEHINAGNLYLFQIYSKDFSPHSKGKPNLHTMYWRMLFSNENLMGLSEKGDKKGIFKLNGGAELFYRKKSITYTPEIKKRGHHSDDLKDKFEYPIFGDRRYAEDKYFFHASITLNFGIEKNKSRFNTQVNTLLQDSQQAVTILGIDRGERHLLYFTLIDQQGNILQQGNLNSLSNEYAGKSVDHNYWEKLDIEEKKRADDRRNWKAIGNIRNLKSGYLSAVIHRLCKMIIDHNAIVVLEDLNFGFKRGRFKIEKQVYQKFEKMLIDKLNYLVFKNKKHGERGGVLNAYQLTDSFQSFEKLGKQSGILFYVPAGYTSKICPRTGFVNLLYPRYE
ncbi:MAG: type V CRISPR-associated protein Cas12a/Cpf1, partial [Salinispira sp.]